MTYSYDAALPVFVRVTDRAASANCGKYWTSAYLSCIFIALEIGHIYYKQ